MRSSESSPDPRHKPAEFQSSTGRSPVEERWVLPGSQLADPAIKGYLVSSNHLELPAFEAVIVEKASLAAVLAPEAVAYRHTDAAVAAQTL